MSRFHPPSPLAGRLATQSLLFALGEGTFMTGSAVFFTQLVGLSAAEVGLGLTIAGVAAFIAALPAGAAEFSGTLGRVWAPALYTFVAMNWGAAGWLVIAAIGVVATLGLHPSVRAARRFLVEHVPPDELAQATAGGEPDEPVPPPSLIEEQSPVR